MLHRTTWLAGVLLALGSGAAHAQAPPIVIAPDLAFVPANAYGFTHVRLATIAAHPAFESYRASLAKAGPKALAAFDSQFVPRPTTFDRVTVALVPGDGPRGATPLPLVILRFGEKFDSQKVLATYVPADAKPTAIGALRAYAVSPDVSFALVDDQTILLGPPAALQAASAVGEKPAALARHLGAAGAGTTVVYATVDRKSLPIPPEAEKDIPDQFRPLAKVESLTFAADLGKDLTVSLKGKYPTAADAKAAEAALQDAAKTGRQQLATARAQAEKALFDAPVPAGRGRPLEQLPEAFGQLSSLAGLAAADELLAKLPITLAGDTLAATTTLTPDSMGLATPVVAAVAVGLLLPAVQKVREAAARTQSTNNLKQIALAMHNYESGNGKFPMAAITDKDGKPLLSWRVAILPYIEQDALYKQFKLDEPWDSDHNKKLIPSLVKVYQDPRMPTPDGSTYYKVFTGKRGGFDFKKGRTFANITDGSSNTLMVAVAGPAVPWTKPEDFVFDGDKLPDLSKPFDILLAAMFDGSVRAIRTGPGGVDEKMLKALITPDGGEVIGDIP